MKTNNLYLDIHAIQSVPPSNINRDDTGSPKTAQYGGATRARVSSQCWKKAMRDYFLSHGEAGKVGVRTKDIVTYVAEKIREKDAMKSVDEAMEMADKVINLAGVSTKDYKAKALFFLGNKQAEELAMAALRNVQDKNEIKLIMKENPAIDIALFGRMVADEPMLNEDASCQVAHAISTHAVSGEYDYFTAIDDLSPEDNAGAGMIGTIEYNSSTLYRYADIAVHELYHQLGNKEAAISAVTLFIEAFIKSMPTGKVNTFANQTLPQGIIVTLRSDRPVNLVSAFEEPVQAKGGYAKESMAKLAAEYKKAEKIVQPEIASFVLTLEEDSPLTAVGKQEKNLDALLHDVGGTIEETPMV
ncbi:type I-E CRISPR-associated protein Cas7/Cse4/CasC [uncultured Megasphaera sp.]|uniref:type I-E CRISPR-associated protein Cas7/Cse4/CasC n=1 Tax=uncultured Megasphaera sp. TaxID=165188 RepID=UPI00259A48AF|nr:type I-E CRISPR-associated protein Cas7/Cse4/CasC [uncultured Megasphaera sp.]